MIIPLDTFGHKVLAHQLIEEASPDQVCVIKDATRTTEQNSKMWPMLRDLSNQVVYHGFTLSLDEWKSFATATLERQKIVPNMDGDGFIALGQSTSSMSKKKFSDLIEIIYMIGAKFNVKWSRESEETIAEHIGADSAGSNAA